MEYRTELSLEENIENWTNNLSNSNALNYPDIEELKSHVFDEIDNLMGKGLNEEEAFIISVKRLGNQETITEEFGKVNNSYYARITPYLKGILIYLSVFGLLDVLQTTTHFIIQPTLIDVDPTGIFSLTKVSLLIMVFVILLITLRSKNINWKSISKKLSLPLLVGLNLVLTILKPLGNHLISKYSILNYDQMTAIHMNYSYFETISLLLIFLYGVIIHFKSKRLNKLKLAKQ